jgi:hypothetical protein
MKGKKTGGFTVESANAEKRYEYSVLLLVTIVAVLIWGIL